MRLIIFLAVLGICIASLAVYMRRTPVGSLSGPTLLQSDAIVSSPTPEPQVPFVHYEPPELPVKKAYRIILLGDSMTAALGPYADELRLVVKKKYPDVDLIIENQSAPSSNVESLQDRLLTKATEANATYEPVLGKPFDIIVIESFGYNPLSHLGRTEGIDKANESLFTTMRLLNREQPSALVVFLATIAPSHTMYGVGAVELDLAARESWASERDQYIENHIAFAKEHNIPLVDIYNQTKDKTGSGVLKYINPTDHIHPSQLGVNFIQDKLAQYFIDAKLFE
ncbi:MAG: SGNH/GDSL hydrolase family protein [Candidatus Woesebacteria bacterium]